jgi:hypothetical protein
VSLRRKRVQKLHRNERLPIFLADIMNRADVGMIQGRGSLGLPLKASKGLGIEGEVVGEKLESDKAVQPCILGFVDDTHPAATQLF